MSIDGARKDDMGKAPVYRGLFRYFPRALQAVAEVSGFGATKYAWGGWRHVENGYNRYSDGLGRHQMMKGVEGPHDTESGLLHDAHIAWNALATLELYLQFQEEKKD